MWANILKVYTISHREYVERLQVVFVKLSGQKESKYGLLTSSSPLTLEFVFVFVFVFLMLSLKNLEICRKQ